MSRDFIELLRWIPHRVSPYAPGRDVRSWSVGSMALMRRYDGEPVVRVELDTSVELDVSVNGSCGETVGADVTADAYIEDIKYCPFCGEEL
ncbi:MAG: hypothetical protein KHW77_06680 [Adlercreutzia equolifaciens]|nr:hypothetical protein [Adlercreutzia equolifaciens]